MKFKQTLDFLSKFQISNSLALYWPAGCICNVICVGNYGWKQVNVYMRKLCDFFQRWDVYISTVKKFPLKYENYTGNLDVSTISLFLRKYFP